MLTHVIRATISQAAPVKTGPTFLQTPGPFRVTNMCREANLCVCVRVCVTGSTSRGSEHRQCGAPVDHYT